MPRGDWHIEDRTRVVMPAGFEPGKIYELVYTAQDPVLVGLGPTAVRDLISFLKYGGNDITVLGDPSNYMKRAYGFGISQSGRFLRTFLYYGFNRDEHDRQVFDGVLSHVAGAARGSFNFRFAQPSRDGHPFFNMFYPTDIFPFTDLEETDPETGLTDGLLVRAIKDKRRSQDFLHQLGVRILGPLGVADSHLDRRPERRHDPRYHAHLFPGRRAARPGFFPAAQESHAEPDESERLSLVHARAAGGHGPLGGGGQRAAALAISAHRAGHARAAGRGAVPEDSRRRAARAHSAGVSRGLRSGVSHRRRHHDRASESRQRISDAVAAGGPATATRHPACACRSCRCRWPRTRDGTCGRRISARPDELYSMQGSFIPFLRTKAERELHHDPRPSIEERYAGRAQYLEKIEAAARNLASGGYLLEGDVPADCRAQRYGVGLFDGRALVGTRVRFLSQNCESRVPGQRMIERHRVRASRVVRDGAD